MQKKNLWRFAHLALIALVGGFLLYICMHFFPKNDDIGFADWALRQNMPLKELLTVQGVCGRYLGDIIGIFVSALGMTSFLWVRNLFHFAVLFTLFLLLSKLFNSSFQNTPPILCSFLSAFLLMTVHPYGWGKLFGETAFFVNYICPLLFLIVIGLLLLRQAKGQAGKYTPLGIACTAFFGSFFMEHMTLYTLAFAVTLLVLKYITKNNDRKTEWFFVGGALLGTIAMFSYPLLDGGTTFEEYRDTPTLQTLPKFIWENIYDNANYLLWDNWILCLLLSGLCILAIFFFWRKKLWLPSLFSMLIFAVSGARGLFCFFGDWSQTVFALLTSKAFGVVLTFLWLFALGYTIWMLPGTWKEKQAPL